MARGNSNSESDSKPGKGSKGSKPSGNGSGSGSNTNSSSNKQRLTAAQQQYLKSLVSSHITNNHPDLQPKYSPVDFEHYSDEFLRNYKDRFALDTQDNMTFQGYLLGSRLGSKTYSFRRNMIGTPDARVHKKELSEKVARHFDQQQVKEMECIPQFVYKVKNQKKKFRMEFRSGS